MTVLKDDLVDECERMATLTNRLERQFGELSEGFKTQMATISARVQQSVAPGARTQALGEFNRPISNYVTRSNTFVSEYRALFDRGARILKEFDEGSKGRPLTEGEQADRSALLKVINKVQETFTSFNASVRGQLANVKAGGNVLAPAKEVLDNYSLRLRNHIEYMTKTLSSLEESRAA